MRFKMTCCTIEDIGIEITGTDAPPIIAAINEYLSIFEKPALREKEGKFSGRTNCCGCGQPLDGFMGTFTWGIAHGEGACSKCGWPARAYHEPKDSDGNIFDRPFQMILQYRKKRPASVAAEEDTTDA